MANIPIRSFIVIVCCLFSMIIKGQDKMSKRPLQLDSLAKNAAQQLIYLQLNKGVFETGEDLWFKAYHMDTRFLQPSALDTTLYIQLRQEHTRKLISQGKFAIKNGFSDGYLGLPDTIPPGNYIILSFSSSSDLNDSTEYKNVRRIKIMKRMQSQLKIDASSQITGATSSEEVDVNLHVMMKNKPLEAAKVVVDKFVAGKLTDQLSTTTTAEGKATLKFKLQISEENVWFDIQTSYDQEAVNSQLSLPLRNKDTVSLNFFPEGGHLVADQHNEIAFMSRRGGIPIDIVAELQENGKPIAQLKSLHNGMGKFGILPKKDAKYTVKISGGNSSYELPKIEQSGSVLRMIRQTDQNMLFLLTRNDTSSNPRIFISAQVRGMTMAVYSAQLSKDSLTFNLPKDKLPQGIVELTIYNADTVPILERLIYLDHGEKIAINANLSRPDYRAKDKVVLNIIARNEQGKPVRGHFGVSVFHQRYQNNLDHSNISSHALLNSQIRGAIINPEYYFDESNKDRALFLDLLLMTQGWRKYRWGGDKLVNSKAGKKFIDNHVQGIITSKVSIPKNLLVFTPEKSDLLNLVEVAENGKFQISKEQLSLSSRGYIYVKPIGSDEITKNATISISDSFKKINESLNYKKIIVSTLISIEKQDTVSSLPKLPGVVSLEQVNIKAKAVQNRIYSDRYMAGLDSIARFSGNFDYVGKCGWLNCGTCASGTKPVEGVRYSRYKDGRTHMHGSFSSNDVIKTPYEYPNYTEEQLLKLFNIERVQAFAKTKEFYTPDYDQYPAERKLADYRNTLIWNPSVITNEKGEASISFYCSDLSGKFIASVEGIESGGRVGQLKLFFDVKDDK